MAPAFCVSGFAGPEVSMAANSNNNDDDVIVCRDGSGVDDDTLCLQQVLCSAVSEQTLLKTVTQIFSEAESAHLANDSNGRHPHLADHCSTSGWTLLCSAVL